MSRYKVIPSERADADLERIQFYLMGKTPHKVEKWTQGLLDALDTLEEMSRAYAVAWEQPAYGYEVRALLYGNYRVLYTILDTDGDGEEDTVRILHIRHGAQDFSLPAEEELDK